MIVLARVTAWGIFSLAHVGVEDGSSGLSVLGWVSFGFFMPGRCLMDGISGAHTNADVPPMAAVSWVLFSACGVGLAQAIASVHHAAQQAAEASKRRAREGQMQ